MGIEIEKFVSTVDEDFMCSICTLVLEDPIKIAGCEHMFCRLCIKKWIKQDATCPVDRKIIDPWKDLIAPDRTVVNMLNKLKIRCEFESLGCVVVIRLERWKTHVNDCDFNPVNYWQCNGCKKVLKKKEAENHRCLRKLETEIVKLKKENDKLKSINKIFGEENQSLKQENSEQNDLIKELVDENAQNQVKYKRLEKENEKLLNENEALKLSMTTSSSSLFISKIPINKNVSLESINCNIKYCSLHQLLENKTTSSSVNKWLILSQLPYDLKSQIRLASILETKNNNDAIIITIDDQTFWIRSHKRTIINKHFGEPIKFNELSGLRIKSLKLSDGPNQEKVWSKFNVLAVTEDGKLLTWSYLEDPQSKINEINMKDNIFKPMVVNLDKKMVDQVACGYQHTLALTSDGVVWAWGDNRHGQLGVGSNDLISKNNWLIQPKIVNAKMIFLNTVAVACCGHSSFAVMDNGDVYSWGNNWNGELGLGGVGDQTVPMKIEALEGIKIQKLACGWNHVLALSDDGSMFAWGLNYNGQLGTGDKKNRNKPIKVGPSGVKFFEVGAGNFYNHFSMALSEDGRCWVWGRCRTRPMSTETEDVLCPKSVESTSINNAIAEYAIYQTTWKTMVIQQLSR